ncbi:DeoR/GlpR family DNA-binding transcription regulator [Rothia terrae]|uniref:DeoR/GlpR family DNA-binding transcription regulator n=1 Tax=Rothia terrae TaxID=396015 RepID=UPI0034007462
MESLVLADERQTLIVAEVDRLGTVSTAALIERFGVSPITIRRDLAELAAEARIIKIHGGARSIHTSANPSYAEKFKHQQEQKQAIAQAAAAFITDGTSVGISAGSTSAAFASHIQGLNELTVVTNSMRVADEFKNPSINLLMTGGRRSPADALVGPLAIKSLEDIHVQTLFTSTHAVDLASAFSTPDAEEAALLKHFISSAERVVMGFDHSKWGVTSFMTFAQWNDIDVVITDEKTPETAIYQMKDLVEEVVIAQ